MTCILIFQRAEVTKITVAKPDEVFPPKFSILQFRGCLQTGASPAWKAAPAASVKIAHTIPRPAPPGRARRTVRPPLMAAEACWRARTGLFTRLPYCTYQVD